MTSDNSSELRKSVVEQTFEALRVLHVSWLVSLVTFVVLALPPQVHDIYRMLAEDLRRQADVTAAWTQIGITTLLLLLAAFLSFYCGRHRASVYRGRVGETDTALASALRWGPAICGALIIAGAALGMHFAGLAVTEIGSDINPEIDRVVADIRTAATYLELAAIGAAVTAVVFLLTAYASDRWAPPRDASPYSLAFDRPVRLIWGVVVIGMTALAFFPHISVPFAQWLGATAIFLTFVSAFLIALTLLQTWSDRHRFPWSMALIAWGLVVAFLELNKPGITLIDRPQILVPQVQERFVQWYEARKDKDAFVDQPYPVFLVATEAGGLYAAQFAAKVLARLQDRCENFAQHVFAISGVSGGSLGAAIFASLAKQGAPNGGWKPCKPEGPADQAEAFEAQADRILRSDFLAPIVSRGLFADFLQHFVPSRLPQFITNRLPSGWDEPPQSVKSVLAKLSRGRAFEETVEQAWDARAGAAASRSDNVFAGPFLNHWSPEGAGPALLLNTTSVSDGRQVFIAPFQGDGATTAYDTMLLYNQPNFPDDKDVTLSSAVGLSGRFPWILPASTVGSEVFSVVDGAYFESSGVETLGLVRRALRPYEVKPSGAAEYPYIKVYVIVIGSFQAPFDATSLVLDEATPPVRTLLKARDRRGYHAFNTLLTWDKDMECPPRRPEAQLETSEICNATFPILFRLNYDYFNLPLGWTLSEGSSRIIEHHARGRCREHAITEENDSHPSIILEENKRAAAFLVPYYLTPKQEGEASMVMQPPC